MFFSFFLALIGPYFCVPETGCQARTAPLCALVNCAVSHSVIYAHKMFCSSPLLSISVCVCLLSLQCVAP